MNDTILEKNETAFYEKYGISLQDRWNGLTEEERSEANEILSRMNEKELSDQISFEQENILRLIVGFGGRECLKKMLGESLSTVRVMIWEPDESVFLTYCINNDISDFLVDDRIEVVLGRDKDLLEKTLWKVIQEYNAFHMKAIASGNHVKRDDIAMFSETVSQIASDVTEAGFARKKFHKLPGMNFLYALHTLDNNYVISQLYDAIPVRNIPVIIAAAGPSLMKNGNELKKAKNKALIVAVSHAAKALESLGVEPDFVAVSDALQSTYLDHDKDRKYILLSSIWADRFCAEEYNGKVIYHGFNMAGDLFKTARTEAEPDAELDTGSVATDVFILFQMAGFQRIILAGQDLAYDDNGYTHAGNESESSVYEKQGRYSYTEGLNGGRVKTREDWESFRKFYERRIKEDPDIDVIDATEGGALIHGTRIMKLSEAIDKYCRDAYPISEWIKTMKKGDDREREFIDEWFDKQLVNLQREAADLERIISLNEKIMASWGHEEQWNEDFQRSCSEYDGLYDDLMNESAGDLLKLYCVKEIQNYVENALALEGDENVVNRMRMEYDLFVILRERASELIDYMKTLTGQNDEK